MTVMAGACASCGTAALTACHDLSAWGSVTSDCRPWPHPVRTALCEACGLLQKPLDAVLAAQVEKIYEGYTMYQLSDGREQLVFSELGAASTRSSAIVEHVDRTVELPARGRMLDVGCGNGAMLTAFGARRPDWVLAGLERDGRCCERILALPGVEHFHTPPLDAVEDRYDVITMIHVLEHVERPVEMLRDVRRHLQPGGLLVVEVPDLLQNPFDIVILDHYLHFTEHSAAILLRRAGFAIIGVARVIPKELTLLARAVAEPGPVALAAAATEAAQVVAHGRWLASVADTVKQEAATPRFGVFGTAVAGTWCGAVGGQGVEFFVDEDPERVGKQHMMRPVLHPDRLVPSDRVFLAFPPGLAAHLAARLRACSVATYIAPPARGL
jgi:SAM-dependent methyltransferase